MIERLIAACKKVKKIYIYGAGKNAACIYDFLKQHEIPIEGFLVSDMADNPRELFGRKVEAFDEFSDHSSCLIVVSLSSQFKAYKEILDRLVARKVCGAFFLSKSMLEEVKEDILLRKVKEAFNVGPYHLAKDAPSEMKHIVLAMNKAENEEYHWRVSIWNKFPSNIAEAFQNKSALEEFEEGYGTYHIFHTLASDPAQRGTCAVYMARSHVDKELERNVRPDWLIPIQVGAALTDQDICEIKDNTGENISERNGNYSECSALYWMWKNAPKTDYIGLCHYRRHFDLTEKEIGRLSSLDVLVTAPTFVEETIGTFFSTLTPESDLRAMMEAIEKLHPEYAPTAKSFMESRFFPPCNLFIMKYDLFQEYGAFVFSITFEIEHFYAELGFHRNDRYMGYLVECLMGIFLMKNKDRLKIGYTDMRFID